MLAGGSPRAPQHAVACHPVNADGEFGALLHANAPLDPARAARLWFAGMRRPSKSGADIRLGKSPNGTAWRPIAVRKAFENFPGRSYSGAGASRFNESSGRDKTYIPFSDLHGAGRPGGFERRRL
jgi:hypothetical protein